MQASMRGHDSAWRPSLAALVLTALASAGLTGWLLAELFEASAARRLTTIEWLVSAAALALSATLAGIALAASRRTARLDRASGSSPDAGLEERLRASEARWRAIIESAVDGIVIIDVGGHVEAFNPAAERLFGYSEAEMLGRNVAVLMPSPDREEHDGYLARYMRTGEAHIIGLGREVTAMRRDGTTFPVHLSVGEITVGGERRFTGIIHDLSQRVRIEEQLREQTALARLGEMAAVIAHEVKNPLAGVRGAIEVLGSRLPADGLDHGVVQEIVARIDALDQLMSDLLLFARPPQARTAPVDLVALISRTAELLGRDPSLAGVRVKIEGTAPTVNADADMLTIVFQNLLVNAAQAMQGRGTIRVQVGVTDGFARVVVADQGPGISPELHEKIFTPFFTTKARGTGLGLPTARRFIEAHHGRLQLHSPLSGGAVVTVELPI
jgi:two-component system sensor kinase FixL